MNPKEYVASQMYEVEDYNALNGLAEAGGLAASGMAFGPIGAAVGGGIGLGKMAFDYFQNKKDKEEAERQKSNMKTANMTANYLAERMAKGGVVKGPGTGTSDSVKAKLNKGDVVIPAKNAKKVLEELTALGIDLNKKADTDEGNTNVFLSDGELLVPSAMAAMATEKGFDFNQYMPEAKDKLVEGEGYVKGKRGIEGSSLDYSLKGGDVKTDLPFNPWQQTDTSGKLNYNSKEFGLFKSDSKSSDNKDNKEGLGWEAWTGMGIGAASMLIGALSAHQKSNEKINDASATASRSLSSKILNSNYQNIHEISKSIDASIERENQRKYASIVNSGASTASTLATLSSMDISQELYQKNALKSQLLMDANKPAWEVEARISDRLFEDYKMNKQFNFASQESAGKAIASGIATISDVIKSRQLAKMYESKDAFKS